MIRRSSSHIRTTKCHIKLPSRKWVEKVRSGLLNDKRIKSVYMMKDLNQ